MKTKFYLSALALTAAFASCSQEEIVSDVAKTDLGNRPVVGQVTFNGENETRFNPEVSNGFEVNKDVMGLYLMDEYQGSYNGTWNSQNVCPGEHEDANTTYWRHQNHWFSMYKLVNYISSNYPFGYVAENGKNVWKNDAKLVEGNYFAMFPQNEEILNRRELWHYINPTVQMVKHSSNDRKVHGVDNQFFLGYAQIYRDATASAEGELKMDLPLKGAMAAMSIELLGWQGNDVKLDKISFKRKDGKPVHTIAYVEPLQEKEWRKTTGDVIDEIDDCKPGPYATGLYNATATWTKATIRSLINWQTTENGRIPYGLEESKQGLAYEYSFTYPANTIISGDVNQGTSIKAYIVLPGLDKEDWEQLVPAIYGWRYINSVDNPHWEYGILLDKNAGNQNYTFQFGDNIKPWEGSDEQKYWNEVQIRYDNLAWKAVQQNVLVASTADMEKMVYAWFEENPGNGAAAIDVYPDAAGVEVRTEFVNKLKEISAESGRNITINFKNEYTENVARNGKVVFNNDNTMAVYAATTELGNMVTFNYAAGLTLENNAAQTVPAGYEGLKTATVDNYGTISVQGYVKAIKNYASLSVANNSATAIVEDIDNYETLILGNRAYVSTLDNKGTTTVQTNYNVSSSYFAEVVTFNNHSECYKCDDETSHATVVANSKLIVTNFTNKGDLTNNATVEVNTKIYNEEHKLNYWPYEVISIITNNGTIENAANATSKIDNDSRVINNGSILTTRVENGLNAVINNYGSITPSEAIYGEAGSVINAYGTSVIKNLALKPEADIVGTLNVYSADVDVQSVDYSEGDIYIHGVVAEDVATAANDTRYYVDAADDVNFSDLLVKASKSAAYNLVFRNNATLTFDIDSFYEDSERGRKLMEAKAKVASLNVQRADMAFLGQENPKNHNIINFEIATLNMLQVNASTISKLNILNGLELRVNALGTKNGDIHVGSSSRFFVNGVQSGDIKHVEN